MYSVNWFAFWFFFFKPGKSDFLFLKYCKGRRGRGGNGPLMMEGPGARDCQQRPCGHSGSPGGLVGVFLQSLLYVSPELASLGGHTTECLKKNGVC